MRRFAAALIFLEFVGPPLLVEAGEGLPPLDPPILSGPVAEPSSELPPLIEPPTAPPVDRNKSAVLVVPGLNTSRTGARYRAANSSPPATARSGLPSLVGPSDAAEPGQRALPTLTLESVPPGSEEFDDDSLNPAVPSRRAAPGGRTTSNPAPSPASRRSLGILGRIFPTAPFSTREPELSEPVKVEVKTDPAADAALKRRVERQIRDTLAARLGFYEVRVVGREVVIQARAARFWQKRGVRRELESLPALGGYKASVLILD